MYLNDYLRAVAASGQDARSPTNLMNARAQLRFPWCWPADTRARTAEQLGVLQPRPPTAGETCLVAVSADLRSGGLWKLTAGAPHGALVPLKGSALRALDLATHLASRDLPLRPPASPVQERNEWSATRIYEPTDGAQALDGGSYGLAMCLAAASRLLGMALPVTHCATGTVFPDGVVGEVEGIERKVEVVAEQALAVTTFLVPHEQAQTARDAAAKLGWSGAVVAVRHVRGAIEAVLPKDDVVQRLEDTWSDEVQARRAAKQLLSLALESKPTLVEWSGVARAAELLYHRLQRTAGDDGERAWFAWQIALRHCGIWAPIPWDRTRWLAPLSRPVRVRAFAHVVQSFTDSDETAPHLRVDEGGARALVRPREERTREDLVLLGAIGRACAAGRRYAEAADLLRETVEGWFDVEDVPGASHALCEYLRVLGILGDAPTLESVGSQFVSRFETESAADPVSTAFVELALGRAWTQAGRPAEALEVLADASAMWARAPQHVIHSRLRWLARALEATGRRGDAALRVGELERASEVRPEATPFVLLAHLDAALAGGDPASVAERLALLFEAARKERTSWGHGVIRLGAQIEGTDAAVIARAHCVADEFGY